MKMPHTYDTQFRDLNAFPFSTPKYYRIYINAREKNCIDRYFFAFRSNVAENTNSFVVDIKS